MACFILFWLGNGVENEPYRRDYEGIKEAETGLKEYLLEHELIDYDNYRWYLKYFHSNSYIPISEDEKKINPDEVADFDEIAEKQFELDFKNPDIPLEDLCIKYGGFRFYTNGQTQRNWEYAFWNYDISIIDIPYKKVKKKF